LPPPWGDEVLTAGVSSAFVVAACFAVFAALVALLVIQVRASDLARLQGGATPGVTAPDGTVPDGTAREGTAPDGTAADETGETSDTSGTSSGTPPDTAKGPHSHGLDP
ncbi:MFS transporter, partial [Streptomyces sp. SID2119]|nr:MFS transporter [Streptomyces sp. SID2119]